MSLKAKIEAVIYASEEPVTLAQLIGLLGHEAQAELDHLESAQHSLGLNEPEQSIETEAEHAAALDRALHLAAAEEAAHLKSVHEHAAADAAAMRTSDTLDPEPDAAEPASIAPVEQGSEAAAVAETSDKKAAREAREDKERARCLREYFRSILDQLIADYGNGDRGLEIREVASGYRLSTKPEYHDAVRGFIKSLKPPLKLSLQALETLAVVAYKQPVTAPEVSEIRGVDSGGVLGSLMARKLVTTAGRKQVIGRPILYKTTKDFLLRFGLKDINELPSIEEFEKMAGELAEQEEIPMEHEAPETPNDLEPEKGVVEPQADGSGESADDNPAEQVIVDGRLSGLPPNYNTDQLPSGSDSPALDAEVQTDVPKDEE
ncbi:MAG TPA: SMC-Scp complex subunit ScpB [Edaphobacter sp.]|jgi:segregation and condensation protein B|nr:SMC-Scp complex subunit ScpB [Edaphobacter sp.]